MRALVKIIAIAAVVAPAAARAAEEEEDAFARVIVAETELRAGPGVSHRVIYRAHRGETFLIQTRETSGFWLQVLMADGRTVYVLGDTVEAVAVSENAEDAPSKPGFFAPPALQEAHAGFALMGGMYDRDGYVELKPAYVLAPSIAFEPFIGLSLKTDSRRLVYGLAGTLNLAPDWAIAPFVTMGFGGMHETPKDEQGVRTARNWFQARAGGGLLVSLRWRVLFRLEASNMVLYSEDAYQNVQSYIAGLGTYF
ncbi:MAG TPA: SH3 domain-containing protein [Polyangiaceae bacterium]|nr:SH3 domain-containing protein [Polyangiaceae bacterium]